MKYSAVLLLFLGVLSQAEARNNELVQVIEANGMTAVVDDESSGSDSGSDDESSFVQTKVQGDDGIIDALTPQKPDCDERLWISADEMIW